MGEVYRARHVRLGREAAVKVVPAELAAEPERLRRLGREVRAASALNHSAIVTIYDVDEHEGTGYIAMELVEGVTLRRRLDDGPLDRAETLRLALAIAEGLACVDDAGIVHRDLKPDNVMIGRDGRRRDELRRELHAATDGYRESRVLQGAPNLLSCQHLTAIRLLGSRRRHANCDVTSLRGAHRVPRDVEFRRVVMCVRRRRSGAQP